VKRESSVWERVERNEFQERKIQGESKANVRGKQGEAWRRWQGERGGRGREFIEMKTKSSLKVRKKWICEIPILPLLFNKITLMPSTEAGVRQWY